MPRGARGRREERRNTRFLRLFANEFGLGGPQVDDYYERGAGARQLTCGMSCGTRALVVVPCAVVRFGRALCPVSSWRISSVPSSYSTISVSRTKNELPIVASELLVN